jgi:NADH:quinone reductase (non-electrogenic)
VVTVLGDLLGKKVVVVGGGYAGTEVIRQLLLRGTRGIDVELISSKANFENTIGGSEIISGKVKVEELIYDLKKLSGYWNFEFVFDEVKHVNLNQKTVGTAKQNIEYDILVLAMGSEPNFFGVPGASLTDPAYSLSDFEKIGSKLKQMAGDAPHVAVAGAGFVGLESTAEILDLFQALNGKADLTVVEKAETVLPAYNNDKARKLAFEHFTSRGAKFALGNGIEEVRERKLILENGESIEFDIAVWTAGVKGCLVSSEIPGTNLHRGCVDVDDRLCIVGREDAFGIGDIAYVRINDKEAMKMAGEALEQAKTAAKNIDSIVSGRKPILKHAPHYTTDYTQALLSMGQGKAMLVFGSEIVAIGTTEYFLKKRIDFQEMMERFPQ